MSVGDRIWDMVLVLAGIAAVALGLVDPKNAQLWVGLTVAFVVLGVLRWQRFRLGRWLGRLAHWMGGDKAIERYFPVSDSEPAIPADDGRLAQETDRQRAVIEAVRDLVEGAMVHAEQDRESGIDDEQKAALAAASRAGARAHEIADDDAAALVTKWKALFDAIPKGWKKIATYSPDDRASPGYPEPAWSELKKAAEAAQERLGRLLR